VASAKSWLSHAGVDRSAALLPWTAPPDVPRLSPLEVSTRYLRHFVDSWNHAHADDPLEQQTVVLTVPASFDDVARNLTVEAAKKAGLASVSLIEEPQAAFYAWMHTEHVGVESGGELRPGMRCVVVDVGGGTCDLSLIAAIEEEGELTFVREAVGDHLLLGGDNMDLAVARLVESRFGGAKLDAAQFGQLIQSCRQAKESLLGPKPPASFPVTIVGRGRAVVGGTLTANLTGEEIRTILFDGFFPEVAADAEPSRSACAGLHEMGLPYEQDAAITRHLAAFLQRHLTDRDAHAPDAILFNGGVFQPPALRDRLLEVMHGWYGKRWKPLVLTTPSLDLAVAWGAAAYAWLRHTGGKRIGGGIARGYYVGVDAVQNPPAADGTIPVLCVVPRHLAEEEEIVLAQPELDLTLGAPVLFSLFTSTVRDDKAGDVLHVKPSQLLALPPLTTIMRAGKRAGGGLKHVPVSLAARSTAVGTLEIHCVAKDGGTRWRLEFNTREIVRPAESGDDGESDSADRTQLTEMIPEAVVQSATAAIEGTFAAVPSDPTPQDVTRALESALEAARADWPTGVCRRLADKLVEVAEGRNRSPAHRSRWFNLLGFALRPGYGDPLDRFRVDQLWKLLHAAKPGAAAPPVEAGADVWIMWRRVAGGLPTALQQTLFDRARPFLLPGKGKAAVKPGANELVEMWRAAAALERLDSKLKVQLGDVVIKQVRRPPAPTYAFWSLTRLGNRVLLEGPLNAVVHPEIVGPWIDALLGFEPQHESESRDWAFCLANLARKSGQRALEIDDHRRHAVQAALRQLPIPDAWRRMVDEFVAPEAADRDRLFGEAFPSGLRLR
jgi:hypothetical protein